MHSQSELLCTVLYNSDQISQSGWDWGGESSKKHGDAQKGLVAFTSDILRRQQVLTLERQKENTPPWRIVYHIDGGISRLYRSRKLRGLLGRLTHRFQICSPPFLPQSSGQQRSIVSPSAKGRIQQSPWFHTANIKGHHIQPNQEREKNDKSGPVDNQKGIGSFHYFIQHTFWPSCGCQEAAWDDVMERTFECWCVRGWWGAKEKATGLRLRVKAEVIPTRDDPSDVS